MKRADRILGKIESGLPQQSWISRTPTGEVADPGGRYSAQNQSRTIDTQTKTLVNMIFARFMAIYGHKFKSAFETENEIRIAKREWALSLVGYNEPELVQAVNYCKEHLSWMPTISEFLQVLQNFTSDLGVPDPRSAYEEACRYADHPLEHDWSHPIVYWSGRQAGWFELRNHTEAQAYPQFEYQYQLNLRKLRSGGSLDIPNPAALEQKSELTQAQTMLSFAKEHQIDEAQACKLLYYLTLPEGSRSRSRQYHQAQQDAEAMGLKLPTEA